MAVSRRARRGRADRRRVDPVNAALGNDFRVTLAGNRTLANPSNPANGQVIKVHVTQDATGSRTLAYYTNYDWGTGGAPTLTTTAA